MINHLLLDIEGTTCPVTFVTNVLFPYAKEQLKPFIETHQNNNAIKTILNSAQQEWEKDTEKQSQKLQDECQEQNYDQLQSIIIYLSHLIKIDRPVCWVVHIWGHGGGSIRWANRTGDKSGMGRVFKLE